MIDLVETLRQLISAIAPDNGAAVIARLTAILQDAAPFDAGEVVLLAPRDFRRALGAEAPAFVGADCVAALASGGVYVRFDEPGDAARYPHAESLMRAQGMRSLLALPLSARGAVSGVIVLGARATWAFAGVAPQRALAVAETFGWALVHALALSEAQAAMRPTLTSTSPRAGDDSAAPQDGRQPIDDLMEENARLKGRVEYLERQVEEWRSLAEAHARENAEARRKLADIERAQANHGDQAAQLRAELEEQHAANERAWVAARGERDDLAAEVERLRAQIEGLQAADEAARAEEPVAVTTNGSEGYLPVAGEESEAVSSSANGSGSGETSRAGWRAARRARKGGQ
ncbi:MAG: hypothetical protein MUF51_03255 [Vicinamibacteria bacterium]|jgi:hypothetical protein|nr:hypothetical protein [Vicinamibacteria bacterium]